jgi:hypothetical protein
MTDEEFRSWLSEEVAADRMTAEQSVDLLAQKALFDARLGPADDPMRKQYDRKIVGFVDGVMLVGEEIHQLLAAAERKSRGRMIYFESIGFDLV